MIPVEIRDSIPSDVRQLVRNLRTNDRGEILCLRLKPMRALRACYDRSFIRRTALVDGKIAAMWGLSGNLLSDTGEPWLMTTPEVERVRLQFVKRTKIELRDMLEIKPILRGYVAAGYTQAVGFLQLLGFTLGEPQDMGGALFQEYTMGA